MIRRFGLIVAGTVAMMGAAYAADLPVKSGYAPVVAPIQDWSGLYIGGNIGGIWSRSSYTFDNGAGTSESFNYSPNSYIGGGHLGLQGQSGNWVLGAEGTWSFSNLSQTQSSAILANINGPSQRSMKVDQIATVTAKLGYAWSNMLVYGKVGYAGARMKTSSDNLVGITSNTSGWANGITAGLGVDYMLYKNLILGAALDYYDLSGRNMATGTSPAGFTVSYNNPQVRAWAATARLSYLFGWGR